MKAVKLMNEAFFFFLHSSVSFFFLTLLWFP